MEKKPLVSIDETPVDVWYEGPSVMAVKKPQGIRVHPREASEKGTLLNRLFQHNRWLAEMETSRTAGVLHVFEQNDHGLMLFNKSDNLQKELNRALAEKKVEFSYVVTVTGDYEIDVSETADFHLTLNSQKRSAGYTVIDLQATSGDTQTIRDVLFPDLKVSETTFYCYEISLTLPGSGEKLSVTLRDSSKKIPDITVYHAPP
ncbi:MAG TPA: pseudouridine synthase [Bacillales bacterium]|nr:pseudouridine synthase [Bacillales bacterium]